MFGKYPDVMTVEQVKEALNIGRNSAYALIKNKEIGCVRVGRTIRVPKSLLIDYVQTARYNMG